MHFLLEAFKMNAIALVSVINPYHMNGLHLFVDNLYKPSRLGLKNTSTSPLQRGETHPASVLI